MAKHFLKNYQREHMFTRKIETEGETTPNEVWQATIPTLLFFLPFGILGTYAYVPSMVFKSPGLGFELVDHMAFSSLNH